MLRWTAPNSVKVRILKLKGMFNDNGIRIFKEIEGNRENPKETAQKLAEEIKKEEMKNEKR